MALLTSLRLCRLITLALVAFAAMAFWIGDRGMPAAWADPPALLALSVTGPQVANARTPLAAISVRLVNPGPAAPDSRLRVLVRDDADREMLTSDIKIDVLEGAAWKSVEVEPIDGGIMGAVGPTGQAQNQRHKHGGFAIAARADKRWRLRITFQHPGRYSLVVAVSPDNGATHLAQPASLSVEAL